MAIFAGLKCVKDRHSRNVKKPKCHKYCAVLVLASAPGNAAAALVTTQSLKLGLRLRLRLLWYNVA